MPAASLEGARRSRLVEAFSSESLPGRDSGGCRFAWRTRLAQTTRQNKNNAFELAEPALRPRAGSVTRRGYIFMKSVQPDNTNPIPLRSAPPRMGIIMIRFVGLLVVAVVVLALIWSR
jgi:hypothetical protein